jgi:hypothetical protein
VRPLARWEAKPSRSKVERIMIKCCVATVRGKGAQKERRVGAVEGEREFTLASQKYTPVLRARGVY